MPTCHRQPVLILSFSLLLGGCAPFDPNAGLRQVQDTVAERGGQQVLWQRHDAQRQEAADLTRQLLNRPLNADAAVRLALLNNPELQARFAELGIAEAQAVASSLLRNPFLHAAVHTPRDEGRKALDFSVSWDVLGLFSLPLRQAAAADARQGARLQAAAQTLRLAAETRSAWYADIAARESAERLRDMQESSDLIAEIAKRLDAAGNQAGLARADAQAASMQSRYALEDAEAQVEATQARLLGLLGVERMPSLPERIPRLPQRDPAMPSRDELEERHLDLALLKSQLAQAEQRAGSSRRDTWTDGLEMEWSWSRESDGAWQDGPGIGIGIPLFDTGAAARAAAGFEVERLQAALASRRNGLMRESKLAEAAMRRARARVEHLRENLLPLLSEAQDTALLEYNAMHRSVAQLLDLKRREQDAVRQLVQGLGEYWQARTVLEALHLGVSIAPPAAAVPRVIPRSAEETGH